MKARYGACMAITFCHIHGRTLRSIAKCSRRLSQFCPCSLVTPQCFTRGTTFWQQQGRARAVMHNLGAHIDGELYEAVVKVLAAQVGVACSCLDLKDTLVDGQQRHIKGPTAQVKDEHLHIYDPLKNCCLGPRKMQLRLTVMPDSDLHLVLQRLSFSLASSDILKAPMPRPNISTCTRHWEWTNAAACIVLR